MAKLSLNSTVMKFDLVSNNFLKNIFVNSWPPWSHLTLPKILCPNNKKSPAKSKILWLTNSFSFLKPLLFKTLFPSTTIALSKDPPLARPNFFPTTLILYLYLCYLLYCNSQLICLLLITFSYSLIFGSFFHWFTN